MIRRSVGIYLLLVPRIEALASPYQLNEQRRSPRRYVYKQHRCSKAYDGCLQYVGYNIPMSVFVALILD